MQRTKTKDPIQAACLTSLDQCVAWTEVNDQCPLSPSSDFPACFFKAERRRTCHWPTGRMVAERPSLRLPWSFFTCCALWNNQSPQGLAWIPSSFQHDPDSSLSKIPSEAALNQNQRKPLENKMMVIHLTSHVQSNSCFLRVKGFLF